MEGGWEASFGARWLGVYISWHFKNNISVLAENKASGLQNCC